MVGCVPLKAHFEFKSQDALKDNSLKSEQKEGGKMGQKKLFMKFSTQPGMISWDSLELMRPDRADQARNKSRCGLSMEDRTFGDGDLQWR